MFKVHSSSPDTFYLKFRYFIVDISAALHSWPIYLTDTLPSYTPIFSFIICRQPVYVLICEIELDKQNCLDSLFKNWTCTVGFCVYLVMFDIVWLLTLAIWSVFMAIYACMRAAGPDGTVLHRRPQKGLLCVKEVSHHLTHTQIVTGVFFAGAALAGIWDN